MTLNTLVGEAILSFRLQLSEEDVIYWNKAVAIICCLDLLPVSEYCMQVKDIQGQVMEYDYAWAIPFDSKLFRLECNLESEEGRISLYFCFVFMFKFYEYLRINCPGFKVGWYMDTLSKEQKKEEWLFLTSYFARIEIDIFKKHGFSLQNFMNLPNPTIETPVTKVVTEIKDQIVCAQIANDDAIWENLKYSPVEEDGVFEEVLD